MYEYLDREPQVGDVVEYQYSKHPVYSTLKSPISIVTGFTRSGSVITTDTGDCAAFGKENLRVIKTKPGSKAEVGDTCIRITDNNPTHQPQGTVFKVTHLTPQPSGVIKVGYKNTCSTYPNEVKVLCKAQPNPKPKAYCKRSGKPWTKDDLVHLPELWDYDHANLRLKWIYEDAQGFFYPWATQEPDFLSKDYNIIVLEDTFPESQPSKQTTKETSMTLQDLINNLFQATPETDYDKRTKFVVVVYNNEGTEIATAVSNSIESVESKIQSTPQLWGCKVVCYKQHTEVTTAVPVTSTRVK